MPVQLVSRAASASFPPLVNGVEVFFNLTLRCAALNNYCKNLMYIVIQSVSAAELNRAHLEAPCLIINLVTR